MNQQQTWTIAKVLDWTREYFESKSIDSPRLDAELVICHALKLSRIDLYLDHHRPLTAEELARIRPLVQRRGKYEPIHYILGHREFWNVTLKVDQRVLIPRPDTERLVEVVLENLTKETLKILDLCTGSGAIALALAHERPELEITATDISEEAVELAKMNATILDLERVQFVVADLFNGVEGSYDIITANPPYISTDECSKLMPDVREYEPHLALHGGQDGLDVYRRIIEHAPEFLNKAGHLILEIGHDQANMLKSIIERTPELNWVNCYQDLAGRDRVVHAVLSR
ncbi:MAG: peptide chain release factor N(5)-glutamine methyltransferase [Bradymonadia bacterium]